MLTFEHKYMIGLLCLGYIWQNSRYIDPNHANGFQQTRDVEPMLLLCWLSVQAHRRVHGITRVWCASSHARPTAPDVADLPGPCVGRWWYVAPI